jgi:hypothetical protein
VSTNTLFFRVLAAAGSFARRGEHHSAQKLPFSPLFIPNMQLFAPMNLKRTQIT